MTEMTLFGTFLVEENLDYRKALGRLLGRFSYNTNKKFRELHCFETLGNALSEIILQFDVDIIIKNNCPDELIIFILKDTLINLYIETLYSS